MAEPYRRIAYPGATRVRYCGPIERGDPDFAPRSRLCGDVTAPPVTDPVTENRLWWVRWDSGGVGFIEEGLLEPLYDEVSLNRAARRFADAALDLQRAEAEYRGLCDRFPPGHPARKLGGNAIRANSESARAALERYREMLGIGDADGGNTTGNATG